MRAKQTVGVQRAPAASMPELFSVCTERFTKGKPSTMGGSKFKENLVILKCAATDIQPVKAESVLRHQSTGLSELPWWPVVGGGAILILGIY